MDGVVRHRGRQVPAGLADIRVDRRRIAEQIRLPLAGVAADKAEEMFEAEPGRPAVERSGLARLPGRRVVVLAEPGRAVAVLAQHAADRGGVLADDGVVAGIARRRFGDDAEPGRVVIASGEQRRPRRRAQRGRVKVGVAQAVRRDAVERRRRNDPAEGRRRAEADVVGDDEQNIWSAGRRHDARRPRRFRLRGVEIDLAPERLRWRRQITAVDRRRRVRGARLGYGLCAGGKRRRRYAGERQHPQHGAPYQPRPHFHHAVQIGQRTTPRMTNDLARLRIQRLSF